jgi:2-dehydro-3-deoxyphosphogluconate aldolase/(4S)-4-hydroxy-2-oxoglutarate aldolase
MSARESGIQSSGDIAERLRACRVIPVVQLPDVAHARPLGEALLRAGMNCIEVTFRSEAAEQGIKILSELEGLLVGAGTVRSVEQAKRALSAGARFVVSPAIREEVVRYCVDLGVFVSPGVCTPSEVERALDLGVKVVKFFPADAYGGARTLKALGAVYPQVPFIPTGGISADNLHEYLALKNVLAVGGSWLAGPELLSQGHFGEIEQRARHALTSARGAGAAHAR